MALSPPGTLREAVEALRALLPPKQLDVIKRSTEGDLIRFNFNLGSYIRNLWVYRGGSPLTRSIQSAGGRVGAGEEFSNLIIEALWHELNGSKFDVRRSTHFQMLLESADRAASVAAALLPEPQGAP
jgi:uncharacterized protein DUF6794